MEILKKIIVIGLCMLPFIGTSQIFFYNKYRSDTPFDSGNGLTQLPDSSYAITGSSGGFNGNSSQAYLMLLDSLGNRIWTKNYGGWGEDVGVRVIHLPGDGFFIAGYTGSTAEGDFDFVVYKTDEQGELQWEKKYGGSNWEILHDAHLLSDGGLILVGETEGPTTDGADIYMVRTDALGDTLWTKTLSTPEDDGAFAVDIIGSNKFIVGGDMGNGVEAMGMMMVYNYDGTQDWQKFYDQDGVSRGRDIVIYNNFIYMAGSIYDNQPQENRWIVVTDMDGNYVDKFTKTNLGVATITAFTIRDGVSLYYNLMSGASDLNPYPGGVDAFVLRLDAGFNFKQFGANFSYNGDDILNQFIVTNDGGIAIVGTASDAADGELSHLGTDVMVIKIGPNDEYASIANIGNDLVALEKEQVSELPIYPNPTEKNIQIPNKVLGLPYQIVDFQGKNVKEGKLKSTLSLEELDSGLYFLKVIGKDQSWNAKVIKK